MLSSFPVPFSQVKETSIVNDVTNARNIIAIALRLRNEKSLKIKQPLKTLFILASDEVNASVKLFEDIIKEELNVKNIVFEKNTDKFNISYLIVNFKTAGAVLKKDVQVLKDYNSSLTDYKMNELVQEYKKGSVEIDKFGKLDSSLFILNYRAKEEFVISTENNITLVLDTTLDRELMLEGAYRELVRTAQVLRKEADFNIDERIELDIISTSDFIKELIQKYEDKIKQEVLVKVFNQNIIVPDIEREVEVGDEKVILKLKAIKN